MVFQSVIPILFSADVAQSINYYTAVLDFKNSWTWEDPPTFGGVSMADVQVYFCKNGQGQPGTWFAINLDDVDEYYKLISRNGAKILNPPQSFEWGMREMLVEDPDGHRIRFGQGISVRNKSELSIPLNIEIISGLPTPGQMKKLTTSVNWTKTNDETTVTISDSAHVYSVLAKNKNDDEIIGCAFLLTDNNGFYYIRNVIVHPDWQGKRIGTELVKHLDNWLIKHAPEQSTVMLHTGPHLAPFYKQFGFSPSYGMQKKIMRNK